MESGAYCNDCIHRVDITTPKSRWDIPHRCKEVLNILLRHGYQVKDFCYCSELGEIRSLIAEIECDIYRPITTFK